MAFVPTISEGQMAKIKDLTAGQILYLAFRDSKSAPELDIPIVVRMVDCTHSNYFGYPYVAARLGNNPESVFTEKDVRSWKLKSTNPIRQ
jgi:hypothetical protein